MNTQHATRPLASRYPTLASNDAIEWEDMPPLSLRNVAPEMPRLVLRTIALESPTAWGITMPATLDDLPLPVVSSRETLQGLVVREVTEPEVFRHFFG